MTTINTIEDLARILRDHPTWAEALRALLLTQDLMDLPERFDRFVREQREFNGSMEMFVQEQREFNESQQAFDERAEGRFNALQRIADNLVEQSYEMKVADNLHSLLRQHLGLRNTRILKGPNREADKEFAGALDQAQENGLITEEELAAALHLDIIARANTQDGRTVCAAMEVSVTVQGEDVTRARDRAETIARATGTPAEAVVIVEDAAGRAAAMIEDGKT